MNLRSGERIGELVQKKVEPRKEASKAGAGSAGCGVV
eukprot:COSAG02_NODE_3524_length_6615_cov_6.371393_10_plen_37_part_00